MSAPRMGDHLRLFRGRRPVAVVPGSYADDGRVTAIDLQERSGRRMRVPVDGLAPLPGPMRKTVVTFVADQHHRAWWAACREVTGPSGPVDETFGGVA